jgi:photosystem II stability/assembly factor-like uncharacterized protein
MEKKTVFIVIVIFFVMCSIKAEKCLCQWVQTNGPNGVEVYSIFINNSIIYAGTYNGIYKTTNNGNNWLTTSLTGFSTLCLNASGSNIYAGTTDGVYRSTNYGNNWSQFAFYMTVPVIAISGNYIFLGTNYKGIYRSTNSGNNWYQTSLNSNLVHAIVLNGSNYILAGTAGSGVYISTNAGNNWTQTQLNNKSVNSLALSGSYIFAGVDSTGVYYSTNNGSNWTQTSLNSCSVYSLLINSGIIFAGTSKGMYISKDNGTNWIQKNQGFGTTPKILSLLIAGNYVFSGTSSGKVYIRPFYEIIGINKISEEIPDKFSLMQNYPNPFNQSTIIKYKVKKEGNVCIKIYNALGIEVETIFNLNHKPGEYQTVFNAENMTSGIYFYKLEASDFKEIKKMILIK